MGRTRLHCRPGFPVVASGVCEEGAGIPGGPSGLAAAAAAAASGAATFHPHKAGLLLQVQIAPAKLLLIKLHEMKNYT